MCSDKTLISRTFRSTYLLIIANHSSMLKIDTIKMLNSLIDWLWCSLHSDLHEHQVNHFRSILDNEQTESLSASWEQWREIFNSFFHSFQISLYFSQSCMQNMMIASASMIYDRTTLATQATLRMSDYILLNLILSLINSSYKSSALLFMQAMIKIKCNC